MCDLGVLTDPWELVTGPSRIELPRRLSGDGRMCPSRAFQGLDEAGPAAGHDSPECFRRHADAFAFAIRLGVLVELRAHGIETAFAASSFFIYWFSRLVPDR